MISRSPTLTGPPTRTSAAERPEARLRPGSHSSLRSAGRQPDVRVRRHPDRRGGRLPVDPTPTLTITACPQNPLGDALLGLSGDFNDFSPEAADYFLYSCDGYYLNVDLQGRTSSPSRPRLDRRRPTSARPMTAAASSTLMSRSRCPPMPRSAPSPTFASTSPGRTPCG